jgi:PAN domain
MIKKRHTHFPGLLFFPYPVLAFMMLNLVPLGTSAFSPQSTDVPTDHSTEDRGLAALIVHVNQSLNFDASDGQLVVVPVGAYLVEPILQSEPRLILWHEHGTVTLQAARTTHDQRVETPEAHLIREDDNEDRQHMVVFIPAGTALEATGSLSGIQTRGKFRITRHYQLDRTTGVIQFGDGRQGRRLPTGQSNISAQYRKGSGAKESELDMMKLQSVIAQRQRALALTTNLINKISGRFQLEEGTDRPGNDYARHMEDSPDSCRTRCAGDGNCQAFTFVKPNPGSAQGQCFLKRSEPQAVANHCCVSGTRSSPQNKIIRNIGR